MSLGHPASRLRCIDPPIAASMNSIANCLYALYASTLPGSEDPLKPSKGMKKAHCGAVLGDGVLEEKKST
jgi:hypothetical protein